MILNMPLEQQLNESKNSIFEYNNPQRLCSFKNILMVLIFASMIALVMFSGTSLVIHHFPEQSTRLQRFLEQVAQQLIKKQSGNMSDNLNKNVSVQNKNQNVDPTNVSVQNKNINGVKIIYQYAKSNSSQEQNQDENIEQVDSINNLTDINQFGAFQQENFEYVQDPTIQWPQQNSTYFIYNLMSPRLLFGVDGDGKSFLYGRNTSLFQKYYFQRVHQNFYYIISEQSNNYMTKPQRTFAKTTLPHVSFSNSSRKLWKLVPAQDNIKNSFYILSKQDQAIGVHFRAGFIQSSDPIVHSKFKKITQQVWVLRQNPVQMNFQTNLTQRFNQKLSQQIQNIMRKPSQSFNQAITFEQLTFQSIEKNITLPQWIFKPGWPSIGEYDLPFQLTANSFSEQVKREHLKSKLKYFDLNLNPDSIKLKNDQNQSTNDKQEQSKDQKKLDIDQKSKLNQNTSKRLKQQKSPEKNQFHPNFVTVECATKYKIAYIWYGQKEMPIEYKYILNKCRDNVIVLRQNEFLTYVAEWNKLSFPSYQIVPQKISIRQRINMLKLLYLYFQSGIYADFDTQINEKCFQDIFSDELIFSNRMYEGWPGSNYWIPFDKIIVPEENFMMVRQKFNPQVKRMIEQKILEQTRQGDRWQECKYRQCLILQCQRHYKDNTYKKGYV